MATSPLHYIDDVYNLAYIMTQSQERTGLFVSKLYLNLSSSLSKIDLFKAFRNQYLKTFGNQPQYDIKNIEIVDDLVVYDACINSPTDFKLTLLLASIINLPHSQISEIIGVPIHTIRKWLFWGRKLFKHELTKT